MEFMRGKIGALVAALLPFVVHFGDRSTVTRDGETTVLFDYNYAGVVFGLLAVGLAIAAARNLPRSAQAAPVPHYAILAAIAALGVYQALDGAALI
jgi:hypothetical protein